MDELNIHQGHPLGTNILPKYTPLVLRFNSAPGVGQNIAWALTQDLNLTQIIDDLWYKDIR